MMKTMMPHKVLLVSLVILQIIGPSWVLALQSSNSSERGRSENQALIAGLAGVVTVNPGDNTSPGFAPKYRTTLSDGDVITTEEDSVAELLLNNSGLIAIQEYSEAVLDRGDDGRLSVALGLGTAEWSLPPQSSESLPVIFKTPNIRATSQGGLVTVAVRQTLAQLVLAPPTPSSSFLIRTSLQVKATAAVKKTGLSETFCVSEGDLTVEYSEILSGIPQEKVIKAGECLGFLDGQLQVMGSKVSLDAWRAVCVVGTHCEIPESAKKLISKKQMGQALALERALVGSDSEDAKVDEQVVLATTGLSLGASIEGSGPGGPGNSGVILPTTGGGAGGGPGGGPGGTSGGGGASPPPKDFPDANVGGTVPPPTPFFNLVDVVGGGSPPYPGPSNIQVAESLWPANGMPGGEGLLSFIKGNFTADIELLLADSGLLASAPHLGKAPQSPLVVSDLSPIPGANTPSNQKLPLKFGIFNIPASRLPVTLPDPNPSPTSNVQLGVEGTSRLEEIQQLAQFARSSLIDPDNILASLPEAGAEFPCAISSNSCLELILASGLGGLKQPDPKVDSDAGIDAAIQVRSASTMDPKIHGNRVVTLTKGVVLGGNTQVNLALQEKTSGSFSGLEATLGLAPQASAISILGEPGEPAIVHMEDRVLAILGGSRIQSANSTITTTLLAVLDGRLHGPVAPSIIGKDSAGGDIVREDVSPIIEMIGSSAEVTTGVMIGSTANPTQRGDLDQALLEASSPLLAMMQSTMTTASDFGRVAGQNAKLDATLVPGDALVRLDASSLMVNGNLFSVTGGAQLIVNGSLLSVQGGSTATLAGGAFVNVGAGSLFSLTNGALVDFGTGNNMVNVSNSLCAGGGCFAPFANPGWQVAGSPSDFSVSPGFSPFSDLGTFPDGSVNTLNVTPGSAILSVEPGGSITLQ